MANSQSIQVTSHVARDFLQNAAYFSTMPKLVWEYVANSLDAAQDGMLSMVVVEITSNYVIISDNGAGMSREELGSFFQMHGESILRKRGKRVRGRFGTGKCAAFGLANSLRIDTTQSSLRNVVALHRRDVERAEHGAPFPVRDLMVDEPTDEGSGTIVEIRELNIRRPNVDKVISYLERHLSRYRQRARVTVNGHVCQFKEPPSVAQYKCFPPPEVAEYLGTIQLTVKVSSIPLDEDTRGIDILSHGIWHETTLANIEGKDRANHIFGHIDVPVLEDGEWLIPAFDNTRNNTLNRQNPVVVVLLGWLSEELEKVRLELVRKEQQRRRSQIARRLATEAKRISRILNEDFVHQEIEIEIRRRVSRRSSASSVQEILDEESVGADARSAEDILEPDDEFWSDDAIVEDIFREGEFWPDARSIEALLEGQAETESRAGSVEDVLEMQSEAWLDDGDDLASPEGTGAPLGQGEETVLAEPGDQSGSEPDTEPEPDPGIEQQETPRRRRRRRAVFSIDYENASPERHRSRYDVDSKTIFINLDHPQIAAAFEAGGNRTDAHQFREICYEAATVEYAIALPRERLERDDLCLAEDALFDVKDTIDRVTKRYMETVLAAMRATSQN